MSTTFELLRGHSEKEERLFLKIFTEKSHVMIELDEHELADLTETLMEQPSTFDAYRFGE